MDTLERRARIAGLRAELAVLEAAEGPRCDCDLPAFVGCSVHPGASGDDEPREPKAPRLRLTRYSPGVPAHEQTERVEALLAAVKRGPLNQCDMRRAIGLNHVDAREFVLAIAARPEFGIETAGDGRGFRVGLKGQDFKAAGAFSSKKGERPGPNRAKAEAAVAVLSGAMSVAPVATALGISRAGARWRLENAVALGLAKRTGALYHLPDYVFPTVAVLNRAKATGVRGWKKREELRALIAARGPLRMRDIISALGLSHGGAHLRVEATIGSGLIERAGFFYHLPGQGDALAGKSTRDIEDELDAQREETIAREMAPPPPAPKPVRVPDQVAAEKPAPLQAPPAAPIKDTRPFWQREADNLEPSWSAERERAGLAPGLSNYAGGGSSLNDVHRVAPVNRSR